MYLRTAVKNLIEEYSNKEKVLNKVQEYGMQLEYASDELKNDKDVVEKAITSCGAAIKFASNELKNDKEVIEKSVEQYPKAEKYVKKDTLKNDEKDFER